MELYAVDPSGRESVGQLTFGIGGGCFYLLACGFVDPVPSPDGRMVVYSDTGVYGYSVGHSLWIARADGGSPRLLAADGAAPAWSPDSRRIAYSGKDGIHIVAATGRTDRLVAAGFDGDVGWAHDGKSLVVLSLAYKTRGLYVLRNGRALTLKALDQPFDMAVSPDGRSIATSTAYGVDFIRVVGVHTKEKRLGAGYSVAWSPDSRLLAIESKDGIRVLDVRTQRTKLLTRDVSFGQYGEEGVVPEGLGMAWAPDGRTLAYVAGNTAPPEFIFSGDLKTVTLAGKTRTLVSADRSYGGRILSVAWARTRTTSYRKPDPEPTRRVTSDSVLADGPIEGLAADGTRVAFISCDGVFAWTPRAETLTHIEDRFAPTSCSRQPDLEVFDVAVARDRVVYTRSYFCNSVLLTLSLADLAGSAKPTDIWRGGGSPCGGPLQPNIGELAGSGDVLVYGEWSETYGTSRNPPYPITSEDIHRVDGDGCPCPAIVSSPGPLYPADVNENRVVAYGTNETVLFDSNGNRLLSLPVSPLAAQLAGTDLVLLMPGQLRDYDTRSGALLHTWPMPAVPSGPECALRYCTSTDLVLDDAARGLVAYTLNDQIHVLRLADGTDRTVTTGFDPRFMDDGLVYASNARINLVPYDKLPILAF